MLKTIKNHGLPKFVSGPPLGGRLDENSGRPWKLTHTPPCRTPCKLFIHEVFYGSLGLHLRVCNELGRSSPFRPMTTLRLQWSWAFSLVCEVALRAGLHYAWEVHRSWILGDFYNLIGREHNSCPVVVYSTAKSPLVKNMDEKMTWMPTWRTLFRKELSGGEISWGNLKASDNKLDLRRTPTWKNKIYCLFMFSGIPSLASNNHVLG